MSYAILRNKNYKKENLAGLYKHNERKNTHYSNKNINKEISKNNYSIKKCNTTYQKAITNLIQKYNMKNRITRQTNLICEFIITSDKDFFERIGEKETKRYFETAYKFVANYKNLGEDFIISARVHIDEETPHLHLDFVPVVHKTDKIGKEIHKIACSEYWKGKDSYARLQDNFYSYMAKAGFNLERGNTKNNEHIDIERLKQLTNYEVQQYEKKSMQKEKPLETNNIELLQKQNRRVINNFNTLSNQYVKIRNNVYMIQKINKKLQKENENLKNKNDNLIEENYKMQKEIYHLKDYISKTYEYISVLINLPIKSIKKMIDNFCTEFKERL